MQCSSSPSIPILFQSWISSHFRDSFWMPVVPFLWLWGWSTWEKGSGSQLKPSADDVLAEKKNIHAQTRRDYFRRWSGRPLQLGVCSLSARRDGWVLGRAGALAGVWKRHCQLRLEQELVVYGQCWKKIRNGGMMTTQHKREKSPPVPLACSPGTQ